MSSFYHHPPVFMHPFSYYVHGPYRGGEHPSPPPGQITPPSRAASANAPAPEHPAPQAAYTSWPTTRTSASSGSVVVTKKKTVSRKNLLHANADKTKATKTKAAKAKPDKPKSSKRANIVFHKKKKRERWEAMAREILDKLKGKGIFTECPDEIISKILNMAGRCFLGGRMREATMEKHYVLPCIERFKLRKAQQRQLDDGNNDDDDEGGDSPPCEDGAEDDDMCGGGLHDDSDDDSDSSLKVAVPPANHPVKAVVDAASNCYSQRIPRKKRFNSTQITGAGQPVPVAAGADSGSSVSAPSSVPAPPSTRKTITIKAKQDVHLMIVPDQKKGVKDFSKRTVEQRRKEWVKLTGGRTWNGNNKAQKARGLYYSGEAIRANRKIFKIDPRKKGWGDVEIRVRDTVEGREDHFVKIHYLSPEERVEFGEKANEFADKWDEKAFGTSSRPCIQGGMIKCGFGNGAGHRPLFYLGGTWDDLYSRRAKSGFVKGVTECQKALNVMGKSMLQKYFPRAFESIQKTNKHQKMQIPTEIGGDNGICMCIIQSGSGLRQKGGPMEGENFTVECHVDSKDLSEYCASIWTSSDSSDPAGWYFVLPFLTCVHNGVTYEGIAVRLRHGVGIEWSGRYLFHCSTAPDTCGIDVNGTFYGVPGATVE